MSVPEYGLKKKNDASDGGLDPITLFPVCEKIIVEREQQRFHALLVD